MISIAQIGILILLSIFLLLHLGVMLKIIPHNIIWGGRLKSDKEMYRFEVVSILITLVFVFVVLVHANLVGINVPNKIITFSLWLMTGLFLLNTLGNAFSKNKLEKRFFTPVTIILSILTAFLAWSN